MLSEWIVKPDQIGMGKHHGTEGMFGDGSVTHHAFRRERRKRRKALNPARMGKTDAIEIETDHCSAWLVAGPLRDETLGKRRSGVPVELL